MAVYGIANGISQGIGLSTSTDKDFMTWKTYSLNPIITTPTSINASYVGDPYIWKVSLIKILILHNRGIVIEIRMVRMSVLTAL